MDWWRRHVEHTITYAQATKAKDQPASLSALMHLVDGVAQWGQLVGKKLGELSGILAHGTMAEHVIGAKLLADRSPLSDEQAVTVALQLLSRNANLQAMIFGAGIRGFPVTEYRKLLGDHLQATAGYIKDLASGDDASFDAHMAAARKNAMDLDQFTAKVLL